ncbi:hypothetical protein E2C01_050457 [Portunus trituberculatus]|uniref:Uncharacterized protein n=1 Tax=Portunus trituberculatus TaxID=210409 RepID=A0A5B7GG07_PORTR|nr:hypothetical protein [Portunus trituberculatus]
MGRVWVRGDGEEETGSRDAEIEVDTELCLLSQSPSLTYFQFVGLISPPKRIFGVRQLQLHLEPEYPGDM